MTHVTAASMSTSSEAAAAAFGCVIRVLGSSLACWDDFDCARIGVAPSTLRRRRTGGGGLRAERSDKAGSSLQVGRGRTGLRREEPVHRLRLGRARATSGHDLQRELDAIRGETAEVYGFVGWLVTSTAFGACLCIGPRPLCDFDKLSAGQSGTCYGHSCPRTF